MCDLRITELPAAERAEIQRERDEQWARALTNAALAGILDGMESLVMDAKTKGDER